MKTKTKSRDPWWCELSRAERRFMVRAIHLGVHGDVLMPSGRWYRIRNGARHTRLDGRGAA